VNLEKLGETDFEDLEVKVEKICCKFCEEKFFIPANLDLHVQRKHQSASENSENQPFTCLFCGKLFKTKNTYRQHLKVVHKDEAIRCKYRLCLAVFKTENCLKEHLTKDHFLNKSKNSVECKVCKIWLSDKFKLNKHMEQIHSLKVKTIKCEFCPASFDSKLKLFHHTKETHVAEVIMCPHNCYLYFKSRVEMENHFKNAHQIYCKFCDSIFTSNEAYFKHLRQLHLEKKCKFSRCSFYAGSKEELENHVKEKHWPKFRNNLECVYCGKHYGESRGNMLHHVRKFHSKIAIQCEKGKCALFFKSQDDLEKHKKEAHKKIERHEKTVKCLFCQKQIWDKPCYASHIKRCHSEEAIRCKYKHCFTFFKSETDRKIHYGEKHVEKYCCAHCDYITSQRRNFKIHFQHHHLPKDKNKCPQCPKVFANKSALKVHFGSQHRPKKNCPHCLEMRTHLNCHVVTANCPTCSQPFPCKKLFTDHKLKCKKVHKCLECGKEFHIRVLLKLHINRRHKSGRKWRGYKCSFCDTFFADRKSLNNHQLGEHFDLMKYKCEFCEKVFNRRETMRRHYAMKHNIGGFECEICGRRFLTKRSLFEHLDKRHLDKPGPESQIVECADCGKILKKCNFYYHFVNNHF